MDTALAGHNNTILVDEGANYVYKKTNEDEISAYERIFGLSSEPFQYVTEEQREQLMEFVPEFFGRHEEKIMKLENLTKEFDRPSGLDLKMGTVTLKPNQKNPEKIAYKQHHDKVTPTQEYGFRLSGHDHIDQKTGEVISKSRKSYLQHDFQSFEYIREVVREILIDPEEGSLNVDMLEAFLGQIRAFIDLFSNLHLSFCSASLLINISHQQRMFNMKLIDLVYMEELGPKKVDEGFLTGLYSIQDMLEQIYSIEAEE